MFACTYKVNCNIYTHLFSVCVCVQATSPCVILYSGTKYDTQYLRMNKRDLPLHWFVRANPLNYYLLLFNLIYRSNGLMRIGGIKVLLRMLVTICI